MMNENNKDLKISRSGSVGCGVFDEVKISGSSRIDGDMEAEEIRVSGDLEAPAMQGKRNFLK